MRFPKKDFKMNRFDEKYDIRFANTDEIDEVMKFIDEHWKKGHILGSNRDFFEYEMVVDGHVNFLIAKTHDEGIIEGILGYLPCSRDMDKYDIWGVIWKTIDGALPMLGMELKKRLITMTGARTELGVGANSGTSLPLLARLMRYYTGTMKHYYRLADRTEYKIADIKNKTVASYEGKQAEFTKLDTFADMKDFFDFATVTDCIPYKDAWYYERRFYKHPIYKYELWGITGANDEKAVIVTRKQECNGSSAIRIVDYLGSHSAFAGCGRFLDSFLEDSEYIDFYFDGFEEEMAVAAGMTELVSDDANVIPDYFYPYTAVNVDIHVDSSDRENKCCFFKADGDQDRPNAV